ncbi:SHOCT domain-containing protein [Streptomyces sp. NBC_00094]|nr:SHOCT domain-containing protein [Streptomyces sp. NBC_00094]
MVGAIARTAVVAGTASAVSGRVRHHQEQKFAAQAEPAAAADQQLYAQPPQPVQQPQAVAQTPAPAPAPAAADDTLDQLERLAALKKQGVLTDAEFEAQKARILAG